MREDSHRLLRGKLLARNVIWNLLGTGSPLLVAFVSIPILLHRVGTDRFGVITLAWTLIGYAGLFDLGLGRALTKLVSEKLGNDEQRDIPALFFTTQILMIALGVVGALFFAVGSRWLVYSILKIPVAIRTDSLWSFYALAASVPIVIGTAGLRGFLEAQQAFGLVNLLRIPMGVFTFAGPLLVLPFSDHIFPITILLVVARVVGWLAHLLLCFRTTPALRAELVFRPDHIRSLFVLGGWMTVSNVIGPIMLYMDRFVIGALISAAAIAYYATPYEVVTKLLILSSAVSAVMFPAFSFSSTHSRQHLSYLYRNATVSLLAILLPLTVLLIVIARPGLSLWLGSEFAMHSYRVAQLLLIGTFFLAVESLPFALLQGLGRPDVPAKLNLIELPFYAALLYGFIQRYGATGAAAAWTVRACADTTMVFYCAQRLQQNPSPQVEASAVESAIP